MRRRRALEPRETGAGLPVLRHRVAGDAADARRRDGRRRARPRCRAARHPRREARLAGGEGLRQVPELPGDFGVRSGARRAALRVLRLVAARAVRAGQGRVQPGVAAAVCGQRVAGARARARVVRPAMARAEQPEEARAHRHRSRALPAVLDLRRAGARQVDRRGGPLLLRERQRQARAEGALVARRPARSIMSSTTSSSPRRPACPPVCCGRSNRFPPRR